MEVLVVQLINRRFSIRVNIYARQEHASRCMVLVDPRAVIPLLSRYAITAVCRDERVNPAVANRSQLAALL